MCAKITLDATKDTPAYSCLPEASLSVSGHKIADIKDTLDCKDAGDGATKGNYCYCKKDDCNDPKKSGASTLSLQVNKQGHIIVWFIDFNWYLIHLYS